MGLERIGRIESPEFARAWRWFFDKEIPSYTKRRYLPDERVREKPFQNQDARFFSRGVLELSELFTEERGNRLKNYFDHPKFRSAYLLYFLQLHAAKFLTLLQNHGTKLPDLETLRVLDLGSGPGTASFALLHHLLDSPHPPKRVELLWVDLNRPILLDGRALLERWIAEVKPPFEVQLRTEVKSIVDPGVRREECDFLLAGNVMNEQNAGDVGSALSSWLVRKPAWGALWIEPAARHPSQGLSRLRDQLLEELPELGVLAPCLHAQACPLAHGRDWCHFSVPTQFEGTAFSLLSRALGSQREWSKFAYVWMGPFAREDKPGIRLISDPFHTTVLGCAPTTPLRLKTSEKSKLHRGDIVRPDRSEGPAPKTRNPRSKKSSSSGSRYRSSPRSRSAAR